MAAGDINSRTVANFGNAKIVNGTIEVSDTAKAFAIAGTDSTILAAWVTNQDGIGAIQCMPNSNNGTADTAAGSLWCDNSVSATHTVQYVVIISA